MTAKSTAGKNYTDGLIYRQSAWWKKLFNVQYPYLLNIRSLKPGFVLDIGCGIGRNLLHLDGNGIGVDHNQTSVDVCTSRGLTAFTAEDFALSLFNISGSFDSMLLAHVAEHMTEQDFVALVKQYVYLIKAKGKIIVITPQESGYASDDTHIQFMDFDKIAALLKQAGFNIQKQYSFPFPRFVGRFFKYNEFVSVGIKQ